MSAAIELRDVEIRFGRRPVLRGVTLDVPEGRFTALIGKNGAGKSTLIRALVRQQRLSGGRGLVLGRELDDDPAQGNSAVGYVSETIDYAVGMPLSEFFGYYSKLHPSWDQALFEAVLRDLGLPAAGRFGQLSRGQRMQVAFAAAAAARPRLLLLDEITSVLDANARAYVLDYLGRFASSGGTVLMATNIITEVQNHAAHVVLLHEGAVQLDAAIAELTPRYAKLRRRKNEEHPLFSDPAHTEVGLNSDGSVSYLMPADEAKGAPAELLDRRGITLEELFIHYTRGRRVEP
jgi:ABC-2 type transport system ATP-binding protein